MVLTKASGRSIAMLKQKQRRESAPNSDDLTVPESPDFDLSVPTLSAGTSRRKRAKPIVLIDNRARQKRLCIEQHEDDLPLAIRYEDMLNDGRDAAKESELTDLSMDEATGAIEKLGPGESVVQSGESSEWVQRKSASPKRRRSSISEEAWEPSGPEKADAAAAAVDRSRQTPTLRKRSPQTPAQADAAPALTAAMDAEEREPPAADKPARTRTARKRRSVAATPSKASSISKARIDSLSPESSSAVPPVSEALILPIAKLGEVPALGAIFSELKLVADPLLDQICAELPDPDTLCSAEFEFQHLRPNIFEPAHTLVRPRDKHSVVQAKFEYTMEDFTTPEDPALWQHFQQKKYARWAELHASCKRTSVRLVPQQTVCAQANRTNQPQCRACIGRTGGKRCRFADVRYVTQLTVELADGREAKRYLICPVFRSEIEKAPAIRQPVTPIMLPGDTVDPGDDSWIEFHVLCQTVAAIKSLLRRELAVVRDVARDAQAGAARGAGNGAISFNTMPQAVQDESGSEVHPLYGCAPSPCILRKVPFGAHQKCDMCAAPIFSTYFSCCLCMEEVCVECFVEWDDAAVVERVSSRAKDLPGAKDGGGEASAKAAKGAKGSAEGRGGIAYCKRYTCTEEDRAITYTTQHKKRQFVRVSHFSEGELEMMLRKVNRVVQYCDRLDETQPAGYSSISLCANALGRGGQQTRVDSSWINEMLDRIDQDTEVIASLGDADFGVDPALRQGPREAAAVPQATPGAGPSHSQAHFLEAQWDTKLNTRLLKATKHAVNEWQTQPVYVRADELTLREFARLWEEGHVIVVRGLADAAARSQWAPAALVSALKQPAVQVAELNAQKPARGEWTLAQFLQLFDAADAGGDGDHRKRLLAARLRAVVGLADGALRERAAALVPFAQYTAADGQLNLVNRLPSQYTRPADFGPELHCTYGTRGGGGSVDNLRCEVADMVSLLVYAADADSALPVPEAAAPAPARRQQRRASSEFWGGVGGAVEWDIYAPAAADQLRAFLEDAGQRDVMRGHAYMSEERKAELFEQLGDDARSCRVWQDEGDAVFVPAGSTYQRRTFRNTVCVQSKFLSPEHVATARRVSAEVATRTKGARRREALPIMDILWWTWMGSDAQGQQQADEVIATPRRAAQRRSKI